jgi:hypothetical protein
MKIAKPMLMVTTPIGVLAGLYECVRLAGGLVIVMLAMVGVMLAALATVIATIRRESRPAETVANTPGITCKS